MDILNEKTLAIVGCGPKSLAISAKAEALRQLGIANIKVVIFEKTDIAANWCGYGGYTDGLQILGTPPEKDLGFPYTSVFGAEANQRMLAYSWHSFLIDTNNYSSWVDRGKPQPNHRRWADYLQWAAQKIGMEIRNAEVINVIPREHGVRLTAQDMESESSSSHDFDGIVFTGPGKPSKIHDDPKHEWNEHIIDGKTFWQRIAIFSAIDGGDVALVGSGETAASIIVALMNKAPKVRIHIINRHGTVHTRGESYNENRFFTDPAGWQDLPLYDREDFMKRTDRGVFSVAAQHEIDRNGSLNIITGNVIKMRNKGSKVEVNVQRFSRDKKVQTIPYTYDRVIVAIGFDPMTPFDLFPDHLRPAKALKNKNYSNYVDYYLRVPPLVEEDLENAKPMNVHLPMLAGVAQGPGFPNLSCLGTLSDRILLAYVDQKPADLEQREVSEVSEAFEVFRT